MVLDAREVRVLGARVPSDPSISYDSREGLRIAFGAVALGPLRLGSAELGPGRRARLLDGGLGYHGLEAPDLAGATAAEAAPSAERRRLLPGLRLPPFRGLFRQRRSEPTQSGTPRLEAFRLGGGVGATARRVVGQDARKLPIWKTFVPANAPADVKLVQDFLVATGYLSAEHSERLIVERALARAPEAGTPEASLGGTIAAIVEWQRLGATGKGYTADGLIAGNEDRAATHARIFTDVRNKYAGEPALAEPKMVLTADKWHTQARYGFNFGDGQKTIEKEYIAYVKQMAGIPDPADLHTAPARIRAQIKSNRKFSDAQLRQGRAVFVGVDKGADQAINELVTDHFILIDLTSYPRKGRIRFLRTARIAGRPRP
jgi:hypothetical protein